MLNPKDVIGYDEDNLAEVLRTDFISASDVKNKSHYKYLIDYFNKSDGNVVPNTIVIERDYISRSYLNDYAVYYSLCYKDHYERKCSRIHFFSNKFTFEQLLEDINQSDGKIATNENYLGFVVLKNLPSVFIGATLLKTYDDSPESFRHYIKRHSDICFFGRKFILDTLIFQQQDKVVSACATVALWVAFYKTSEFFQTPLPSPSEITESAKYSFSHSGRIFPNKDGLELNQIGNTIESVGLVFELRNKNKINNSDYIKSFIYSYSRLGLPVVLGIVFNDEIRHLVTLTGYKSNYKLKESMHNNKTVNLIAENIEDWYIHDDRIGPYSKWKLISGDSEHDNNQNMNVLSSNNPLSIGKRLNLRNKQNKIPPKKRSKLKIKTNWPVSRNDKLYYEATIESIIVPIHKKIRICFEDILQRIVPINKIFLRLFTSADESSNILIEWDIYLQKSNDYKASLFEKDIEKDIRIELLLTPLPKYVWVARMDLDGEGALEIIYDTTDVSSGSLMIKELIYNSYQKIAVAGVLDTKDYIQFMRLFNPKYKL